MSNNPTTHAGRLRQTIMVSGALLALLLCGAVYAQPANDDCENATVIPGSAPTPPYSDSVDATDATFDPADPLMSCNVIGDGNQTVWYKYTPDTSGQVSVNTFGSTTAGGGELDTVHAVYVGECGALVEVACFDFGLTDEGVGDVEAGTTYYLKVGQFADASAAGTVVVNVVEPPEPEQIILESVRDGISPPISSLGPFAYAARGASGKFIQEVPNVMFDVGSQPFTNGGQAANGARQSAGPDNQLVATFDPSDLLLSFEGIENDDNDDVVGGLIYPPDTNGDVGPNHYVQMANLVTEIFDKSGNSILGPIASNAFFAGLGGQCEFTNSGDPVVLYDEETDRWLVTQFAFGAQFGLCVAVSTSGDPTGTYYQHEFDFTAIGFPDYPKWGFATDAINVMVNLFAPFQGAGLGAIDKAEAMSAGTATMVFYIMGVSEFGFVPGDNDGPVFDNTLPTFFTSNGGSGDRIDVWEINPDFGTPANSTIDEVARIDVTPFDSDLCNAFRERCIDQPEGAPRLEAIPDRLMHRAQTRDFGKRKIAMLSHTVDADGSGKAGVRWYELWNNMDKGWMLKKENTFSPDGDHRWMGSIAMNAAGQTCLGYSISSTETYTSIGVAGRNGTANHMNVGEFVVYDGNVDQHVQTGTAARWGDYSMMSIDPVDDSCWYTQEFARPNTRLGELAGWATGVYQFVVPDDDD
jgi:hypothetical protein